jgi:hypothetical protein
MVARLDEPVSACCHDAIHACEYYRTDGLVSQGVRIGEWQRGPLPYPPWPAGVKRRRDGGWSVGRGFSRKEYRDLSQRGAAAVKFAALL